MGKYFEQAKETNLMEMIELSKRNPRSYNLVHDGTRYEIVLSPNVEDLLKDEGVRVTKHPPLQELAKALLPHSEMIEQREYKVGGVKVLVYGTFEDWGMAHPNEQFNLLQEHYRESPYGAQHFNEHAAEHTKIGDPPMKYKE